MTYACIDPQSDAALRQTSFVVCVLPFSFLHVHPAKSLARDSGVFTYAQFTFGV